jgi:hypothetical protein
MKTNVVRFRAPDAAMAQPAPAQIIPFPVAVRAAAARTVDRPLSGPGPSLGLNIVLALILMLACLLWEAMSASSASSLAPLPDAGQTAVTSPRALLDAVFAPLPRDFA